MKAEITKPYAIAPEGHTTLRFAPGDVVQGYIAEQAVKDGCAIEIGAPKIETPKPPKLETPKAPEIETPDMLDFETPKPPPVVKKRRVKKP